MIFALVDCNNFYVSCERVFNPKIENKAVIILSNNDGCVIARSQEAKKLGIPMGVPAFEIKDLIEKKGVFVFSSNYTLYGDMSQRVMQVLSQLSPDIEIYSVDEAFLRIDHIRQFRPFEYASKITQVIDQWLGIPVSVGLGPSKTLAKAANFLAKEHPELGRVVDLCGEDADRLLKMVPIEEVWGVGEKHASFLKSINVLSAYDLKNANESQIRKRMNVTGARTIKELNGISCIALDEVAPVKKSICTSRSYGKPLTEYQDLEAATAVFVARTAEKLRKQGMLASRFTVFIMTNRFARGPRYVNFCSYDLPVPTQDTAELNKITARLLRKIYRKGYLYKKSGVLAEELVPEGQQQQALWDETDREKRRWLMETLDRINAGAGRDTVRFAMQGFDRKWKMRQERLSGAFTTKWSDILQISL